VISAQSAGQCGPGARWAHAHQECHLGRETGCLGKHPHQCCPHLIAALTLRKPEYCAQDDLQRQRLDQRVQAHRLAARPPGDLSFRHRSHGVRIGGQLGAAERWHEKSPLPAVRVTVKQQHRVRAHHRQQDPIALPGVQQLGWPIEDLFHHVRVRHHHPGTLTKRPQGERVTVVRRAAIHELPGLGDPRRRLNSGRESRTWRQNINGHRLPPTE
jgi:hypothetical protein